MAVQVEMWKKQIEKAFFRKNEFLKYATDVSSEVLNGAVVHIPNSGGAAGVQRNRTQIPATVIQRADSDVVYLLDAFTCDPVSVTAMEEAQISYSKMQSVLDENGENMLQFGGDAILEYWTRNVPTSQVVKATGAAKDVAGLTGTRKRTTAADLRKMFTMFNNMDIPRDNRVAILTSDQFGDLFEDNDIKNTYSFQNADYEKGILPMYAGWKIIDRSAVSKLDNNGAAKLPETAIAGNDDFAGVFFHKSCVEFALGERKLFYDVDRPEYYGNMMSMLLRAGGRSKRADNKGVALLLQAK
jgi:Phage capsid protein